MSHTFHHQSCKGADDGCNGCPECTPGYATSVRVSPRCEFKDPTVGICNSNNDAQYTNSGLYLCIDHRAKSPNTPEPSPLPNPGELPVLFLVVADLNERAEHGKKKYGQYLTAGDGRDHMTDAYQEALDLAMYLRQEIRERELKRRRAEDALSGGDWK